MYSSQKKKGERLKPSPGITKSSLILRCDNAFDDGEDNQQREQHQRFDQCQTKNHHRLDTTRSAGITRRTFAGLDPGYNAEQPDVLEFLLGVEERIHELVRATVPGAAPPRLHEKALGEDGVLVSYTSERGLCRMLEGLVAGTAAHYGNRIALEEIQCMHRGDPGCVFTVLREE